MSLLFCHIITPRCKRTLVIESHVVLLCGNHYLHARSRSSRTAPCHEPSVLVMTFKDKPTFYVFSGHCNSRRLELTYVFDRGLVFDYFMCHSIMRRT